MDAIHKVAQLSVRITLPNGHIGAGKVALLEHIRTYGSITGAAKAMGMSYRRAWHLISTLQNELLDEVVETNVGGRVGGGAKLTPTGESLITLFRDMESRVEAEADGYLSQLSDMLDMSGAAQKNDD